MNSIAIIYNKGGATPRSIHSVRTQAGLPSGNDVCNIESKPLTDEKLYIAVKNMVSMDYIVWNHQMCNLWRIYLSRHEDRVRLITDGLVFRVATAGRGPSARRKPPHPRKGWKYDHTYDQRCSSFSKRRSHQIRALDGDKYEVKGT